MAKLVIKPPTNNVIVHGPEIDVSSTEDSEKGKAPGDVVNHDLLAAGEELINNCA